MVIAAPSGCVVAVGEARRAPFMCSFRSHRRKLRPRRGSGCRRQGTAHPVRAVDETVAVGDPAFQAAQSPGRHRGFAVIFDQHKVTFKDDGEFVLAQVPVAQAGGARRVPGSQGSRRTVSAGGIGQTQAAAALHHRGIGFGIDRAGPERRCRKINLRHPSFLSDQAAARPSEPRPRVQSMCSGELTISAMRSPCAVGTSSISDGKGIGDAVRPRQDMHRERHPETARNRWPDRIDNAVKIGHACGFQGLAVRSKSFSSPLIRKDVRSATARHDP